jgi:hypothetical protein
MGRVKVFNNGDDDTVTDSSIIAVDSRVGTLDDIFIPKSDFSKNPPENFLTCYVLDGGDSTNQPCDDS